MRAMKNLKSHFQNETGTFSFTRHKHQYFSSEGIQIGGKKK